jgi:hypothetical protein
VPKPVERYTGASFREPHFTFPYRIATATSARAATPKIAGGEDSSLKHAHHPHHAYRDRVRGHLARSLNTELKKANPDVYKQISGKVDARRGKSEQA